MSVKLVLADGTERDYSDGTGAVARGPLFSICRWNREQRVSDTLDVFPSKNVLLAEVWCDGNLEDVVFGEGRRSSD